VTDHDDQGLPERSHGATRTEQAPSAQAGSRPVDCTACGVVMPAGSRFCAGCGAELAPSGAEAGPAPSAPATSYRLGTLTFRIPAAGPRPLARGRTVSTRRAVLETAAMLVAFSFAVSYLMAPGAVRFVVLVAINLWGIRRLRELSSWNLAAFYGLSVGSALFGSLVARPLVLALVGLPGSSGSPELRAMLFNAGAVTAAVLLFGPLNAQPRRELVQAVNPSGAGIEPVRAGAALVAGVMLLAALPSLADGDLSFRVLRRGRATGHWTCPGGPDVPAGTNLTSFSREDNTSRRIVLSARFDGDVPAPADPVAGALQVSFTFYLFNGPGDREPYAVFVHTLGGPYAAQPKRMGENGGFIDPSGFDLSVEGDTVRVAFNPAVFTELPAGQDFPMSTSTIVSRYVDDSRGIGYFSIGEESCPPE
jgi:hypothetical protein